MAVLAACSGIYIVVSGLFWTAPQLEVGRLRGQLWRRCRAGLEERQNRPDGHFILVFKPGAVESQLLEAKRLFESSPSTGSISDLSVVLSGTTIGQKGLACLASFPQVSELRLVDVPFTLKSATEIARIPYLRELTIENAVITDSALAAISKGPVLESLTIRCFDSGRCGSLGKGCAFAIAQIPMLKLVVLDNMDVAQDVVEEMQSLRSEVNWVVYNYQSGAQGRLGVPVYRLPVGLAWFWEGGNVGSP